MADIRAMLIVTKKKYLTQSQFFIICHQLSQITIFCSQLCNDILKYFHLNTIIIIFINCNLVVTRWQWLFYMYTKYEIGYY